MRSGHLCLLIGAYKDEAPVSSEGLGIRALLFLQIAFQRDDSVMLVKDIPRLQDCGGYETIYISKGQGKYL